MATEAPTTTPATEVGLAALVAPLSPQEFLRDHWPDKAYWSQRHDDRVAALANVPELQSAEAVMEGATNVTIFKPDGSAGLVPNGAAAMPLYRLGLTCYFGGAHVPALREATERLCAELGVPVGSIKVEIFCSEGESGVKMHSDFDVNFALLLRGNKRWRLAENHHIRNQTGACRPGNAEAPDPLQLELADEVPFPDDMPEDAITLDMEGGSVLFMPRGWWHDTQARGECLQVNFLMNSPMWLSVLTGALRTRLMRDPAWRGYAFDMFSEDPERRDRALGELADLLGGLPDHLRSLLDSPDRKAAAREVVEESGLRPAG